MKWIVWAMVALTFGVSACVAHLQASHEQQVQRMCTDPQYAYETGYNRGMERERLDSSWIEAHCAPEMHASVRESYLSGYDAGASNAPSTIVTVEATPSQAVRSCTFSRDCGGDGYKCRRWGGGNVCMGYGSPGDPCTFSSDCLGGSCRMTPGMGTDKTCR
jgi:hypothetical protein